MTMPETPEFSEFSQGRIYLPRMKGTRSRTLGIYDEQGKRRKNDDIQSTLIQTTAPDDIPADYAPHIIMDDLAIFAGFAPSHFGHFITSGLGRLWAIEEYPPETGILFMTRERPKYVNWIVRALPLLGIHNRVWLTIRSCQLENIAMVSDLYGERYEGRAHPRFVEFMKRNMAQYDSPIQSGSKLYVSRSRLGPIDGRFACEDILDNNLRAIGFHIYHPQEHALDEQLRTYAQYETVVFAEGSAQHVFAFIKKPEQNVIAIARRRALPPLLMKWSRKTGPSAKVYPAIERI